MSPYHNNKIIKISSNNITADSLLNDFDFNLRPSNRTLKLKRESEYCQWQEHTHSHKDSEGNSY